MGAALGRGPCVHAVAPVPDACPAEHLVHTKAPEVETYESTSHAMHEPEYTDPMVVE